MLRMKKKSLVQGHSGQNRFSPFKQILSGIALVAGLGSGLAAFTFPGPVTAAEPEAGPALGAVLFSDTFDSGSFAKWTPSPLGLAANWSVSAGQLRYNGYGHTQLSAGNLNWKNYLVQARFQIDSLADYPGGIRGRVDSSGRSYVVWIYPSRSQVILARTNDWNIDAPGFVQLGSAAVPVINPGVVHTLALSFIGESIEVHFNGTKIMQANDGALATGKIALDVSSQPITFHDVTVHSVVTPLPPEEGPGGPLLVISDKSNPFSRYLTEILDAEGLRSYLARDISRVNAANLAAHDVALLDEVKLTDAQVAMLAEWVQAGGNLIAMKPDPKLASLLGIRFVGGTFREGYIGIIPTSPIGAGLTNMTRMQFHGSADLVRPEAGKGAVTLATLHDTAASTQQYPAVTLRSVGLNGGQAAAFAYGLSRSVVFTRQGNPAWAGQERDGSSPIRSNDLFYGAAAGDIKPDWVDFARIQIPQADEQQRFLRKLIAHMNEDRKPIPSFWYLPRRLKAVVVMTADDHANNATDDRFEQYLAASPAGCSVPKWECIRGTSYIFPGTPISDAAAKAYQDKGFEIALHLNTTCQTATQALISAAFEAQLPEFMRQYPSLNKPETNRTHCVAWANYASPATDSLKYGIRLDTNYYYYPQKWVQDRPGLFTGSGFPMRFANSDGSKIDVYQAATQMTDESGMDYPKHINTLLDNALGAKGYYSVITANMHTDQPISVGSDAIVTAAKARNVPVISAQQLLDWLDMRNTAHFAAIDYNAGKLSFRVAKVSNAVPGLQAMLPVNYGGKTLTSIVRLSTTVPPVTVGATRMVVKGVNYAFFNVGNGTYEAQYK